jgi:hypothetical protein
MATPLVVLVAASAFSRTGQHRYFEALPSVSFHHTLRRTERLVVAFLDEAAADFHSHELEFNVAARSFRCAVGGAGGVHALYASEDARADFIARGFARDHALPVGELRPPFAAYFVGGRVAAWYAGTWTAGALEAWALSAAARVALVADAAALAHYQAAHAPAIVGFFPSLCEGEGAEFLEAVQDAGGRATATAEPEGGGEEAAFAAASTDMALAAASFGHAGRGPAIYAVLDFGRGARLSYPAQLPVEARPLAEWLAGLSASARIRARKDEV